MVIAAAVATAASTALPPFCNMRKPACAASGWEVDTMLRAITGLRMVGYGLCQSNCMLFRFEKIKERQAFRRLECRQKS